MTMNTAQARVVDPVLTNHAQGYKQPKFVGHLLFPRVEVLTRVVGPTKSPPQADSIRHLR